MVGVTYLLQAPEDTLCWLKNPVKLTKTYKYNGQVRTKKIISSQSKDPISFKTLATGINDFFWYRRKVSEGAKGPIEYEFTKRRIVLSRQGLSQQDNLVAYQENAGQRATVFLFHFQCTCQRQVANPDLAERTPVVHRAMLRGDKN